MQYDIHMDKVLELLDLEQAEPPFWRCPRCEHRGLKIEGEKWYCHAECKKGGGAVTLAAFTWRIDITTALERVRTALGLDPTGLPSALALLEKIDLLEAPGEALVEPKVLERVLWAYWAIGAREATRARQGGARHIEADTWFVPLRYSIYDREFTTIEQLVPWARKAVQGIRAIGDALRVPPLPPPERETLPRFPPRLLEAQHNRYLRMPACRQLAFNQICVCLTGLAPGHYRDIETLRAAFWFGVDPLWIANRRDEALKALAAKTKETT